MFNIFLSSLLTVAICSVLSAAPITYQLSSFNFERGVSATGSFRYDFSNGSVSNINVAVSGPTNEFNNFFAAGPVLFNVLQPDFRAPGFVPPSGQLFEAFLPAGSTVGSIGAQLQFFSVLLNPNQPTSPLGNVPFNAVRLTIIGNQNSNLRLSSGQLIPDTSVPEPGTYIAGLAIVGMLYLRRASQRVG